jgi:drug/metabolite transporter (DMT)-like permease
VFDDLSCSRTLVFIIVFSSRGRKMPVGTSAWLAIALFGLIDASCFQGFLTEGLRKTSAGLGSVIIDSQPLTVAVLAALLFGETLGPIAISGLGLGIVGLILLEVHVWQTFASFSSSMTFFQVWI